MKRKRKRCASQPGKLLCRDKSASSEQLCETLRAGANLILELADRVELFLEESRNPARLTLLSHRQEEVLELVRRGHINKEIAPRLNIAERTVKFHVSDLLRKFGVGSRLELIRKADFQMRERFEWKSAEQRQEFIQ